MNTTSLKLWPDEFIALVAQKSANLKLVGVDITEADEISFVVNGLCQRLILNGSKMMRESDLPKVLIRSPSRSYSSPPITNY
jgi:hypothetical protein